MKRKSVKAKTKSLGKKKVIKAKAIPAKKNSEGLGDIISVILNDHRPIKTLIMVLKNPELDFETKLPAFKEFKRLLSVHAKAEGESLYVQLKQVANLEVEGHEGDTEHAIADRLIREVDGSSVHQNLWLAKVKVLAEIVENHIQEEEKEVLKRVKKEFSLEKRVEIGETYSRLLWEYLGDGAVPSKPAAQTETRA